ncbi:hypothetical protein GDO86_015885 [Hymenochirus boettgeri]|uniref:GOLD domain-containing protein n=2 Tax=Hymenochirus boettgeri TaxID=247094 RepID=A0A8T2JZN8_9PIPI|nr:hypothetical protein GDO86_015885 [Hymenochirus boettgeri]
MSAAEDVTSLQEGDNLPGETESTSHCQDVVSFQEMTKEPLGDYGAQQNEGCKVEEVMAALTVEETEEECQNSDRSQSISEVVSSDESVKSSNMVQEEVVKKLLEEQEQDALLFLCPAQPESLDVLMIQSESNGTVDVVKVERTPSEGEGKASPTTWTSANLREFKHRMASEKHGLLTVRRGEVMTVRVPTHPEGKRLCWEFATDDYDIGFGMYFDWTPVTSTAVTLQVSESSDEEDEETESPWHGREGDVERGSVYRLRSRYGEIMQVCRRDSHREVQAGSHEYPGEGVYLLKLDNSYSLMRNKTLYFHVYYSS